MMETVYLGLGSNVGDKEDNILTAIRLIGEACEVVRVSPLYKTEPVGVKEQDWFLNCVVEAEANLKPGELLSVLKSIEKRMDRVETVKFGPRTIDIDILLYGDIVLNSGGLVIPHPRLHERMFVLAPLKDLSPDLVHPILKKTVWELYANLRSQERVERYD